VYIFVVFRPSQLSSLFSLNSWDYYEEEEEEEEEERRHQTTTRR